jgi:hypothetical protein
VKISLERLDTRALHLDLSGDGGEHVVITTTAGLRGTLEQTDERLTLQGVAAESVALKALRIALGELLLSTATGAAFDGLGLTLERRAGYLAFDVTAASIIVLDLVVAVDDVLVTGRVELGGARLHVGADDGSLAAERMELSGFAVRIGELELAAEAMSGLDVAIRWGSKGFALDAGSLAGPALRVATKDLRLTGSGVALSALALDSRHIEVGKVAFAGGQIALTLSPPPAPAARASTPPADRSSAPPPAPAARSSAPPAPPAARSSSPPAPVVMREPIVDLHVLDSLSGTVDVDVDVDLTVPIIGSRKATHRLRIPIDRGSIDYRVLESNLAALENALLDFSVRDGALVLERVNPLFPARGHGKPVVVWDLDATDLAIAETNRVRLAVLPRARLVGGDDDAPKSHSAPSGSAIALRKLGLQKVDVRLALAPVEGPLAGTVRPRHVDSFVLQGSVFHHPSTPPRDGTLLGEIAGASLAIADLRLGTTGLDIANIAFARLSPIEIAFSDVHPKSVEVGLEGATFEGLVVTHGPPREGA